MWHTVMSIKGIDRPDALMPLGIRVEYLLPSPLSNVMVVWVEQLLCTYVVCRSTLIQG